MSSALGVAAVVGNKLVDGVRCEYVLSLFSMRLPVHYPLGVSVDESNAGGKFFSVKG